MTNSDYAREFRDFMRWFQLTYPDYYQKYSVNMKAAKDELGFGVTMVNIDKKIYNLLYEIQNEYYLTQM